MFPVLIIYMASTRGGGYWILLNGAIIGGLWLYYVDNDSEKNFNF